LIHVSQNLAQPDTRERELRASTGALRGLGLTQGLILKDANAEPILESGLTIEIRSLAGWLLEWRATAGASGEADLLAANSDCPRQVLYVANLRCILTRYLHSTRNTCTILL
jgi:hypothetical protein